MNHIKEEPGFVGLVKSEAALLVKEESVEEIVEDGWQDIAELQCGPSTSTIVGSINEFDSIGDLGNVLNVKEELGAIDIGPTVLQHTDTPGTTKQKDVCVQEHTINHKNLNPLLCGGVKEEIIEDKWRGSPTPQDSLMEQPGTCTALHSLHKERLGTICRVQLIRLDTFQCAVCDAMYIDAHKLFQHVQDLHGPGPKRSLHVNPEISIGPQQCTTADTDDQHSNEASQSKQRARSQLYSCDKCVKTYASKNALRKHNRNRHSTESHKCTKCSKKFPSKDYLYCHTITVHSEQQYECAVCKKMYKSKPSLNRHVYWVHRPRPAADTDDQHSNEASQSKQRARSQLYSCDKCVKTYACPDALRRHNRNRHSTESHKCTKCSKKFQAKDYLHNHTRLVHSEQQYECAVCKKMCRSKPALKTHVYWVHRPRPAGSEARIYVCDYCQKTSPSKVNLIVHITSVHASGSYKCSQCNRCFKCKRYLMGHTRRVHPAGSEPRIYICDYCQKTFTIRGCLRAHITQVHTCGSYKCSRCNLSFKCEQYLMRHTRRIHPAGSHQLHACRNCGQNFKSKWYCQQHEKRGKCARPTTSNMTAVASTSRQQPSVVIVKEEPADGELELGPTVFQHMDCNYRPYKQEPQLD